MMSAGDAERVGSIINSLIAARAHFGVLCGILAELVSLSMIESHLIAGREPLDKV